MARRKVEVKPLPNHFQPGHKLAPAHPKPVKRWTIVEARIQKDAIESLLIRGATTTSIVRAMRKLTDADGIDLSCGPSRTKRLIEHITTIWEQESVNKRTQNKAAAERRLIEHIENAKGKLDEKGHYYSANFAAIASCEKLLADMQGTREPTKVQLDIQVSMDIAHLIATFTPEQVQQALTDMNQMERDATLWRTATALPVKTG